MGGGGYPMAYARPLQEVITQGMTLFLETFQLFSYAVREEKDPTAPWDSDQANFVHREKQ